MSSKARADKVKAAPADPTPMPSAPSPVVNGAAGLVRERIPMTPQQRQILQDAQRDLAEAQRTLNLVLTTICAGAGITDGRFVGIEGDAIVVETTRRAAEKAA